MMGGRGVEVELRGGKGEGYLGICEGGGVDE